MKQSVWHADLILWADDNCQLLHLKTRSDLFSVQAEAVRNAVNVVFDSIIEIFTKIYWLHIKNQISNYL